MSGAVIGVVAVSLVLTGVLFLMSPGLGVAGLVLTAVAGFSAATDRTVVSFLMLFLIFSVLMYGFSPAFGGVMFVLSFIAAAPLLTRR